MADLVAHGGEGSRWRTWPPDKTYPTDLTDARWELIRHLLRRRSGPGRPTSVDLRRVINGLLCLTRTGCQWRLLPRDYPYWRTVRYYFDK